MPLLHNFRQYFRSGSMPSLHDHRHEGASSRLDLQIANPPLSPDSATAKPCHGLTFSRGWLIHVAEETVQIAQDGYYYNQRHEKVSVQEALHRAMEGSEHYHSSHTFHPQQSLSTPPPFSKTEFHVSYGTSLQVASQLQQQLIDHHVDQSQLHIGILNSASGKRPEKFLRGTLSQEEGIMRASLLYPCLLQYFNRPHYFYYVNHKPKYAETTSSCAIWTPRVPIIREDSMVGTLLDHYQTFSFVSIPAPNAFALGGIPHDDDSNESDVAVVPKAQTPGSSDRQEPYETMTIQAAMHDRIFRALSIFAEQGCTDLVLCAFGCGVHGNDPRMIARTFWEILHSQPFVGRFRTVAFAIHPSRPLNHQQFSKVFLDDEAAAEAE